MTRVFGLHIAVRAAALGKCCPSHGRTASSTHVVPSSRAALATAFAGSHHSALLACHHMDFASSCTRVNLIATVHIRNHRGVLLVENHQILPDRVVPKLCAAFTTRGVGEPAVKSTTRHG
ncbi:hypothetical protein GUJ93_ZPchr0006g41068 [Zizania palustris]|uniref:Uncharacterized protein n=1 Tax=Zizania palustris TaxID=103762 RepID=A0A8J5VQP8_ZIZPA|nr:hypothetical protein GUJ93_ZPchr0006g41068 [Zizania palustris]